jgi:alpha/beta superfamily hydrolase
MGGTLESKVVHTLYMAFRDQDFHALRFNFRGAGGSAGSYDGGRDEQLDVAAAWQHLNGEAASGAAVIPRVLGGFSFGSYVGLSFAASEPGCSHRVAIAPPLGLDYDYSFLVDGSDRRPLYLVVGDNDPFCPRPQFEELVAQLRALGVPVELTLIPGANHMFDRCGFVLRQELDRIAAAIRGRPGGPGGYGATHR